MELSIILLSVAFIWGIAVITPGPNFFITVQTAIGGSRRSALFVVLGISTGTIIWGLCGFWGINLLFRTVPWIYIFLKLLGGAYLIYLGARLIKSKSGQRSGERRFLTSNSNALRSYKLGLLTNLSNPKSAAFVASLFAATMPSDPAFYIGFMSAALMSLISTIWYAFVAYIFSLDKFRSIYRSARIWIERFAGIVFIGFGIKLTVGE